MISFVFNVISWFFCSVNESPTRRHPFGKIALPLCLFIQEFLQCFRGDTLRIFCIINQNDIPFRKSFLYIDFKYISILQLSSRKFFWDEPDSEIVPYCRQNHVCCGQLHVRRKLQSMFLKIIIQEFPCQCLCCETDPRISRQFVQRDLSAP